MSNPAIKLGLAGENVINTVLEVLPEHISSTDIKELKNIGDDLADVISDYTDFLFIRGLISKEEVKDARAFAVERTE